MKLLLSCAAGSVSALLMAATAAGQSSGPIPPVFPVAMQTAGASIRTSEGEIPLLAPRFGAAPPGREGRGPEPALRQSEEMSGNGKKSVGLAVIYSILLPGMGELYAGDYGSGKYFTGADGVLWLGLGAMDLHARSMRDDARTFAALHAGFDPEGKDDAYFVDVGNFDDVYRYNEQVLRDRDAFKLYDPLSSSWWKWDSGVNRSLYRDQRVAADGMFNNTRFVVAALVANRVLSAINAARIVISRNREGTDDTLEIGAGILGSPVGPRGIALTLTRQF